MGDRLSFSDFGERWVCRAVFTFWGALDSSGRFRICRGVGFTGPFSHVGERLFRRIVFGILGAFGFVGSFSALLGEGGRWICRDVLEFVGALGA